VGFEGSTPRKERKDFPDCSGAIFYVWAWICEFGNLVGRSCFEEIYTENDIECWSGYCSSLVHKVPLWTRGSGGGAPPVARLVEMLDPYFTEFCGTINADAKRITRAPKFGSGNHQRQVEPIDRYIIDLWTVI